MLKLWRELRFDKALDDLTEDDEVAATDDCVHQFRITSRRGVGGRPSNPNKDNATTSFFVRILVVILITLPRI